MALRLDARKLVAQIDRKFRRVEASQFRPEVAAHAKRVLSRCIKTTPVRSVSKIIAAQRKQYANRINYIPSVHELIDPTLIVKPDDSHWLYVNAQWYAASYRHLPPEVDGIYQELLMERERRMQTAGGDFIEERAQARFLYRRSWWQVGQSLGLNVDASAAVIGSYSRHNPRKEPRKAFGQWRGGKNVLSIAIQNQFLEEPSRYKSFSGKAILEKATQSDLPTFFNSVETKLQQLIA